MVTTVSHVYLSTMNNMLSTGWIFSEISQWYSSVVNMRPEHIADTVLFANHKMKNTNITPLYVIVWFRIYVMHLLATNKVHDT